MGHIITVLAGFFVLSLIFYLVGAATKEKDMKDAGLFGFGEVAMSLLYMLLIVIGIIAAVVIWFFLSIR